MGARAKLFAGRHAREAAVLRICLKMKTTRGAAAMDLDCGQDGESASARAPALSEWSVMVKPNLVLPSRARHTPAEIDQGWNFRVFTWKAKVKTCVAAKTLL